MLMNHPQVLLERTTEQRAEFALQLRFGEKMKWKDVIASGAITNGGLQRAIKAMKKGIKPGKLGRPGSLNVFEIGLLCAAIRSAYKQGKNMTYADIRDKVCFNNFFSCEFHYFLGTRNCRREIRRRTRRTNNW